MVTSVFGRGAGQAAQGSGPTDVRSQIALRALERRETQEFRDLQVELRDLRQALARFVELGIGPREVGRSVRIGSTSGLGITSSESTQSISSVAALSAISSGTFSINGTSISVDVDADSLDDVISRINTSNTAVTASLSADADFITLRGRSNRTTVVLDDETSGFFSAANLATGSFAPVPPDPRLDRPSAVGSALRDIGARVDRLFGERFAVLSEELVETTRERLRDAIVEAFRDRVSNPESAELLRSGAGVDVSFREPSRGLFAFDFARLGQAVEQDVENVADFFFRDDPATDQKGLANGLVDAIDALALALPDLAPASGRLIDLRI